MFIALFHFLLLSGFNYSTSTDLLCNSTLTTSSCHYRDSIIQQSCEWKEKSPNLPLTADLEWSSWAGDEQVFFFLLFIRMILCFVALVINVWLCKFEIRFRALFSIIFYSFLDDFIWWLQQNATTSWRCSHCSCNAVLMWPNPVF